MELIINYPTDEDGKQLFESKFAEFQSLLIKKYIDDLNIDSTSKKIVLDGIVMKIEKNFDKNKRDSKNEKKDYS